MSKQELIKKTLLLVDGQWEALEELHPDIPTSAVIRKLITSYIQRRAAERAGKAPEVEVEV